MVKHRGKYLKFADKSLKKDKEIVNAAIEQDEMLSSMQIRSLQKDSKITHEIYMKTVPAGRVCYGIA